MNDIELHDKVAKEYDSLAKKHNTHIHEFLLGMCYEYIKPGESLLDLGIGTGLSSILFAKAGLNITGLDGSVEMLKECEKKGFAKEIKQHNIQDIPLPYSDKSFSHIICCGVFHAFGSITAVFKEVYRMLKPGGMFAFTTAPLQDKETDSINSLPEFREFSSAWDTLTYKHSDEYIRNTAGILNFIIRKEQEVFSGSNEEDADISIFKIFILQKKL